MSSHSIGAILASLLLKSIFNEHKTLGSTLPMTKQWSAFLFEFILTWWLMTVILRVSRGAKEEGVLAGLIIGSVVAMEAMFAGPFTGASMNPARSLAPALVSSNLDTLWIYLIAPCAGAIAAVYTCRWISGDDCCSRELVL